MNESRLVSPDARTLPLRGAALRCDAKAGVARVVLEQRFANPYAESLHVTYTLPLPADAAVSGFRFTIGARVITGEIDRKVKARERFEEAIARGQTAALLEQERSSLFTQELGNVPPGAEVVCEIEIDQKLAWLSEGQWEWRFPLAAAPRYLGAPGRVNDAARVSLQVAESLPVRASLAMHVRDASPNGRSPESPSHPLACTQDASGFSVDFGSGNAVALDRDVVVRWTVAAMTPQVTAEIAGPRAGRLVDGHALVTIVPPLLAAKSKSVPRDLTLLLDTSGSMSGPPLEQAKRIALALLAGLGETDGFEIVEFSNAPRRFFKSLVAATNENKRAAEKWVKGLQASGGTEMRAGILEALHPLRAGCPRQVVLVTDGLIGFETEIVAEILRLLPGDARLHTVGVGSGVNRSLTQPAARAGRGLEVILGLGEDPERAAARLCARTDAPLVVDVVAEGSALLEVAPAKIPDLFAGAPLLISARVRPEGGEIVLRGRTCEGPWEERVRIPRATAGEGSDAIIALFGRECVEDAETAIAGGADVPRTDARIESLGLTYRIATRHTSWIAIDQSVAVDPRDPSRRMHLPQALPYGTSIEGLGLREEEESTGASMNYYAPRQQTLERARAMSPQPAPRRPSPPAAMGRAAPAGPAKAKRDEEKAEVGESEGAVTRAGTIGPSWIGRIILAKGRLIIVEITLVGPTAWDLRHAIARLGGSLAVAEIDAARTTRAGQYGAGVTIRIALTLPSELGKASDLDGLILELASGAVHVTFAA